MAFRCPFERSLSSSGPYLEYLDAVFKPIVMVENENVDLKICCLLERTKSD